MLAKRKRHLLVEAEVFHHAQLLHHAQHLHLGVSGGEEREGDAAVEEERGQLEA